MTRASLLVVADNEANRDVLSGRLRQRGFEVAVAADGPAALAMLAQPGFDLVLLDVEMPGMSGLEVLSKLRHGHSRTELPVIMLTGRTPGDAVMEALAAGANDYITKPVEFPVALARIETHLALKRAVRDLRESEERYALAVLGANDGLWDWNLLTQQVYWSPRWQSILGLNAISGDPQEWLSRIHPEDLAGVQAALADHLANGAGHFESEHRIRHRDDTYRWVLSRGAAVRNEAGVATRFAGSMTDITDAKLADPLTGLPNRFLFLDLVERAIKRSERRPEYGFAVLVLALDRFRIVYDSLGPTAADRLLVAVARRLQSGLRATDIVTRDEPGFTLARLSGDEFNLLIDDIGSAEDALVVADRLRRSLEAPFDVDGQQVYASARMGIAVNAPGYSRAEEILRDATTALHRAAQSGAGACEVFDPAMRERARARLTVETDLRCAIDDQAFEMHYQPIVSLRSGRIAGFEALVRWRHPSRGLLAPAEFIDIAEDTGMIVDIGRMTLAESCRQMAVWTTAFGAAAPQMMCANVSSRQLTDGHLMTGIAATLQSTGLTAGQLKLEITESSLIGDLPAALSVLSHARTLGVSWSLDDFGTGYSSLSVLQRLHVDTVKVDRSFVSAMAGSGNGSEMVRVIVGLAHALGMDVVAEGVETAQQADELRALGCDYAQGFYFSQAVDTATAARLIESQPWQAPRNQHAIQ